MGNLNTYVSLFKVFLDVVWHLQCMCLRVDPRVKESLSLPQLLTRHLTEILCKKKHALILSITEAMLPCLKNKDFRLYLQNSKKSSKDENYRLLMVFVSYMLLLLLLELGCFRAFEL